MDNPITEPTVLEGDAVTDAFSNLLSPEPITEASEPEVIEPEEKEPEGSEDQDDEAPKITIEVDGKTVELTQAEIAEHYKNGLRQADYTRKTMETAEQRKAAESETAKARQERQEYGGKLQNFEVQLQVALQAQQQEEWTDEKIDADPVGFMKHQHLMQARQAQLNHVQQEKARLEHQYQVEQSEQMQNYLAEQHQALLDKLPTWKDEAKAKVESEKIAKYMLDSGYKPHEISRQVDRNGNVTSYGLTDHRAIVLADKAMKYDAMLASAKAAAKKVAPLPPKVERPGVVETNKPDGRSAAMQKLKRSGKVEDAAALFSQII